MGSRKGRRGSGASTASPPNRLQHHDAEAGWPGRVKVLASSTLSSISQEEGTSTGTDRRWHGRLCLRCATWLLVILYFAYYPSAYMLSSVLADVKPPFRLFHLNHRHVVDVNTHVQRTPSMLHRFTHFARTLADTCAVQCLIMR